MNDSHELSRAPGTSGRTDFTLSGKFFIALIAVVGLLLYAKTVFFSFTFADDAFLIISNNDLLRDLRNIPRLFTQDVFASIANPNVFYRPLLNVTFMLETQVAGTSPWLYHLTNILLHVGSSLLLFQVLRCITDSEMAAGTLAVVFCAHPLLASTVAWIPGRNDSLMTLFLLASLVFFLRWLERRGRTDLLLHLLMLFLALLTKESAVVLPPLLAVYWLVLKRPALRQTVMVAGSWLLAGALWFFLRQGVHRSFEVKMPVADVAAQLAGNSPAFLIYLGKIFFPFNLTVFPNLADTSLVWGIAAALLVGASLVAMRFRSRFTAAWGLAWFILFLLPALGFGEIFHEHRAYGAMVGVMVFFSQFDAWKKLDPRRPLHLAVLSLLVAVLAGAAYFHADDFRDRWSYAWNIYRHSPSLDVAYSGMGGLLMDEQRYEEAEVVLLNGVARNRDAKITHRMLGDLYARKGDTANAAAEYERSLQIEPLNLTTYANFGKLCVKQGKLDQAGDLWNRAISIQPDFYLGYYLLANLYLHERNDPETAMRVVEALERRGVQVAPELLAQIRDHPRFHEKAPTH